MLLRLTLFAFLLLAAMPLSAGDFKHPMPFPNLPEGVSSFGAAVAGDHLYVFGGHVGRIPGNSQDSLSPHFVRLNLKTPDAAWETLPMQNSSQSPAILAWQGKVYRVGGLSFDNRQGEATVYHSLDEFSRFDPETKTWTNLPSLPKPRSSLDAAIVDGKVYVVGGWNLQGTNVMEAPWHEDALVYDLASDKGEWKPIAKPPFVKRALAVAGHDHKVWVLGGMSQSGPITSLVHAYDPKTDTWTEGPAVKGKSQFAAFALSAFGCGGKLCYTGSDGILYTLDEGKSEWVPQERLLYPRSFLRLVADEGSTLFAVAGISRSAYVPTVEAIDLAADRHAVPKLSEWTVPFAGKVVQGQIPFLTGNSLYTFGGNNSRNAHDFSKDAIVDEAYRFDLATRAVEKLPPLPSAVQSGAAFLAGERIDQSIYVLGGIANPGEKYQSADTIFRYRLRSKGWTDEVGHLPGPRSMFSVVSQGDAAWIFGGSQVTGHGGGLIADTWQWSGSLETPAQVVAGAALPTPRRSFGAAVLSGKFYAVGGLGEESKIVDAVDVYDFEAKTWSKSASPKVARVFPSVAVAGGKLYLSGGFAKVDGHFQKVDSVEAFDPQSNAWTVAFEKLPFDAAGRTMIEYQDRLLFYGLDPEKEGIAHIALLDPAPESRDYGAEPAGGMDRGGNSRGAGSELVARLMRMDRNQDGKLTKEEVGERFRPLIERADANKDGFATKEEIEASAGRETDSPMPFTTDGSGDRSPERMAARALEEHDANKDGKLERSELEAYFQSRAAERPMRRGGGGGGREGNGPPREGTTGTAPASPPAAAPR